MKYQVLATAIVICSAPFAGAQSVPVTLPTIANGDFETGAAGFTVFPGYTGGSNPAEIPSWPGGPTAGGRGINPGGGAGTPFRDNGNNSTNVAFLQNTRSISQAISGWEAGEEYRVAFDYNTRNSNSGTGQLNFNATIGGGTFTDTAVTPVGGSNSYYAGNVLFTATGESETLTFNSMPTGGDRTLLLDNVRVFRNGPTIADNGFEDPVQPANNWEQANGSGGGSLAGSDWTITGGAGITRNISPFQNGSIPAPEGEQHALIQQAGSFSQTVTGFEVGADYTLSLLAMARQRNPIGNDLEVLLDAGLPSEIVLLDLAAVTDSSFTEYESALFLAEKDTYDLTIRSTVVGADQTTFFDNVFFNQQTTVVPEPASLLLWSLIGIGLTGFGASRVRRTRKSTA